MQPTGHGLHSLLQAFAKSHPEKPVLLSCGKDGTVTEQITYAGLLERVEAAGSHLWGLGLRKGDRIALDFGNSPEFLIASWAAWSVGIVTVPFDVKRDTPELREYKIKVGGAGRIITEHEIASGTASGKPEWLADASHEALILFTSGTTARPKGAVLTLQNLLVNAEGLGDWLQVTDTDRFLVQLPLHHINSTTFCLSALIRGASIALPPGYSNSHFWEQAAKSGATYTSIVQSILFDQLHRSEEYARVKDSLKLSRIQIGSAPVVPSAVKEFVKTFSIPLYQGYGQTETALRVTGIPMNLSKSLYEQLIVENSIGEAMPWADLEIADEKGALLDEGEEGELIVKGAAVMKGYVGGESAFADGYFQTGDLGYYKTIDGRRFFYLKGRKKEIIIKGGINISPAAVENNLQHVSEDIAQAYVVGVPDDRYGEEVAAVIVFKPGSDAHAAMRRLKLRLLMGSPHLSAYETPQYLYAATAEELPMTSTGKVQRVMLKERPKGVYEPIHEIVRTDRYRFTFLTPHSPHVKASLALHNHCWQPLTLDADAYLASLKNQFTLLALDAKGVLAGQISFSYDGRTLLCTSICSATYTPKPSPVPSRIPATEEVERYLREGHDGIFNFHANMGASLVKVIPGGRPEDKSSCGYTMLLSYPLREDARLTEDAPVSNQLIEAARLLAQDLSAEVMALSRPGGLARYLAE